MGLESGIYVTKNNNSGGLKSVVIFKLVPFSSMINSWPEMEFLTFRVSKVQPLNVPSSLNTQSNHPLCWPVNLALRFHSSPPCHHIFHCRSKGLVSPTPWIMSHVSPSTCLIELDISPPPGFACWHLCNCIFQICLSASSHPCIVLFMDFSQVLFASYELQVSSPRSPRACLIDGSILEANNPGSTYSGSGLRQKPYTSPTISERSFLESKYKGVISNAI